MRVSVLTFGEEDVFECAPVVWMSRWQLTSLVQLLSLRGMRAVWCADSDGVVVYDGEELVMEGVTPGGTENTLVWFGATSRVEFKIGA